MASKQERREQKLREKQKQKRTAAQTARKSRTGRAKAGVREAAGWPIADAFLSQDWYESERVVHAVLSRVHGDDTYAAAAFDVDLAEGGLLAVEARAGLQLGNVQAMVSERTTEARAMVGVEPAAIAALVADGLAWRRKRGLPDPKGLADALALLGDLDPQDSPFDFRFGRPGEDDETEEVHVNKGLFGRISALFGR